MRLSISRITSSAKLYITYDKAMRTLSYCLKYLIVTLCIIVVSSVLFFCLLVIDFSTTKASAPPIDYASHYDNTQYLKQSVIDQFRSQNASTKSISLSTRDLQALEIEAIRRQNTGSNCDINLNIQEQKIQIQLRYALTSWASVALGFELNADTQLAVEQLNVGRITLPKPLSDALINSLSTRHTGLRLKDIEKIVRLTDVEKDAVTFELKL